MRILTQFSSIFVIVSMETHGEAANEVVNETGGKKANNSSRSRNTERERKTSSRRKITSEYDEQQYNNRTGVYKPSTKQRQLSLAITTINIKDVYVYDRRSTYEGKKGDRKPKAGSQATNRRK